jgi:hypothetical protein
MKRYISLIITLLHLSATVGVPVVAYSCDESGAVGVVSSLTAFSTSCYVDACCDGDRDLSNVRMDREMPCCELNVHNSPENSRVLLPGYKYEPAKSLPGTPSLPDDSLTGAHIALTRLTTSAFRPSINPPLLV